MSNGRLTGRNPGDVDNFRDAAAAEVIFGLAHLPAARPTAFLSGSTIKIDGGALVSAGV